MPRSVERRRFPPSWSIEEANNACFIVRDSPGQALGYFFILRTSPGRRSARLQGPWTRKGSDLDAI